MKNKHKARAVNRSRFFRAENAVLTELTFFLEFSARKTAKNFFIKISLFSVVNY